VLQDISFRATLLSFSDFGAENKRILGLLQILVFLKGPGYDSAEA
jgi:hypothetical protein